MTPDLRARFEPIVDAMTGLLGVDFLGRALTLDDFAHVGETGHPLSHAATIVWVRALQHAVLNPDAAVGIAETWEVFGDLLVTRIDPVHGPVYVPKRSASERELAEALELIVRYGATLH